MNTEVVIKEHRKRLTFTAMVTNNLSPIIKWVFFVALLLILIIPLLLFYYAWWATILSGILAIGIGCYLAPRFRRHQAKIIRELYPTIQVDEHNKWDDYEFRKMRANELRLFLSNHKWDHVHQIDHLISYLKEKNSSFIEKNAVKIGCGVALFIPIWEQLLIFLLPAKEERTKFLSTLGLIVLLIFCIFYFSWMLRNTIDDIVLRKQQRQDLLELLEIIKFDLLPNQQYNNI